MTRLSALLILTAAFAPAAVMGALPIVLPVVIVLVGVGVAVSALQPSPTTGTESTVAVSEPADGSVLQQ